MLVRTLDPGGEVNWGVPHRLEKKAECQRERWPPIPSEGGRLGVPHRLEEGTRASNDTVP